MTIEDYLATVEEKRRDDVGRLCALIAEAVPGLAVDVTSSGVGYGPYHYRYASGREGDTPPALAGRAARQHISLYVQLQSVDGAYLAERYADRLPNADVGVGKSCVRIKRASTNVDARRAAPARARCGGHRTRRRGLSGPTDLDARAHGRARAVVSHHGLRPPERAAGREGGRGRGDAGPARLPGCSDRPRRTSA